MIKLFQLLGLLGSLAFLGAQGFHALKTAEKETAKAAVEAHERGYISIRIFINS